MNAATTIEELKDGAIEADMYLIGQHLNVWGPTGFEYTFWQPWVGGYFGESNIDLLDSPASPLRFTWVYQDVKEEKGR